MTGALSLGVVEPFNKDVSFKFERVKLRADGSRSVRRWLLVVTEPAVQVVVLVRFALDDESQLVRSHVR